MSNSVDASIGLPLVTRVIERKTELETILASLASDDTSKGVIEAALGTVDSLLSGDLEHVSSVVKIDLNRWLERSKHIGEQAAPVQAAPEQAAPEQAAPEQAAPAAS